MLLARNLNHQLKYRVPTMHLCLVHEDPAANVALEITTPEDAANLLNPLKLAAEEKFVSLHLNAKNQVIGVHEVSHGTLSASLVHPREVFKAALIANSFAIIVGHNHPSGAALVPSEEDMETTEQLLNAGRILGVCVIDHLIVGPGHHSFYSFREHHPEMWKDPAQP